MSLSNVQYPATLTNLVVRRPRSQYIVSSLLPAVFSPNLTGRYPKVDTTDQNIRQVDTQRALATAANSAFNTEPVEQSVSIKPYAMRHVIPGEYQANELGLYSEDQVVLDLANRLELDRELKFISDVSTALVAASLTTNVTANSGVAWNLANSTPITTLKNAVAEVELNCGSTPNYICMSRKVADAIVLSAQFTGITAQTTRPGEVYPSTEAMGRAIAALVGVDMVLIGAGTTSGAKNTAARGKTASIVSIWGSSVLIGHFTPPSLECNSLGLAFYTNGVVTYNGNGRTMGQGMLVSRAVDESSVNAVELAVHQYRADVIANVASGWWLTNCIS